MEERYEPLQDLGVGNFGVARLVIDNKTIWVGKVGDR